MTMKLHRFLMMAVLAISLWLAAGTPALAAESAGSGTSTQAISTRYPAEGHIHLAGGSPGGVLVGRWRVIAGGASGGVIGDRSPFGAGR